MKIPKRFKIFGQTINVEFNPKLYKTYIDDKDVDKNPFDFNICLGLATYAKNLIELQPSTKLIPLTHEQIEATFWHEVFHFIFSYVGEEKLKSNEALVDKCGNSLHQILETMEFE